MHRTITLLLILLSGAVAAETPTHPTPARSFELEGVTLGDDVQAVYSAFPNAKCLTTCVAEDATFMQAQGRFVAGMKAGKVEWLAFRFQPLLGEGDRVRVRDALELAHGKPTHDLGVAGCHEWTLPDGYLAVCLNDELSHLYWSTTSRVDVNKRQQTSGRR